MANVPYVAGEGGGAMGKVAYQLYYIFSEPVNPLAGLMIVQMTDDTHIKVEVFTNCTATDAEFDPGAFI